MSKSTSISVDKTKLQTHNKKPIMENTNEEKNSDTIYFWREYGSEFGCFSQWYLSPFHTGDPEGIVYQTAEQYMMHQKALLFGDFKVAARVLLTIQPKEQKQLGRQVANFSDEIWEKRRSEIVGNGSYFKFKYGRGEGEGQEGVHLRAKLLKTKERELVEASPMDKIWGVGFGEKNAEKARKHWGLNLLGKALMEARERLKKEVQIEDKGES